MNPIKNHYEIEELTILQMTEERDGTKSISFEYMFNEDGFAKNDRSHILMGTFVIGPTNKVLEKTLKETHRGVAATKKFQPKNL